MLHDMDGCSQALSENPVKPNAVNPAVGSACLIPTDGLPA